MCKYWYAHQYQLQNELWNGQKRGRRWVPAGCSGFCTVSCSAKWPSNNGQYVSFAGQKEKRGNVFKKWEISAELCHHGWHLFFLFLIFFSSLMAENISAVPSVPATGHCGHLLCKLIHPAGCDCVILWRLEAGDHLGPLTALPADLAEWAALSFPPSFRRRARRIVAWCCFYLTDGLTGGVTSRIRLCLRGGGQESSQQSLKYI